jgi:hypothetical protein
MTPIDLFYQGEGLGKVEHLEIEPDATFAIVKTILREKHGLAIEALLFIEDHEDPVEEAVCVREHAGHKGLKVHLHRCRHLEVTVTFNGTTAEHRFSPAATVAKVKRWAAEHRFGMTEEEAGEHALQVVGTHDRPTPGTHIGALTDGRVCGLAFDLVADERVNGGLETGA